ncbi:MAG: cytochrome P450 [Rhabdaerophilum sp.]
MGMAFRFYTPPRVIEESGEGYFIAPHPEPRKDAPSLSAIVLGARHSLLGNWMVESYRAGLDRFDLLGRQVVVVNSPEHIKYVMVTRHQNFERKSPQMRRALEVLLGDGLFISEGETWKTRRPLVADIVHKNRVPAFGVTMEQVTLAFAEHWKTLRPDEEFELTASMAELTAEIIAQTVFGRNLGGAAARRVIEGFTSYQKSIDNFNLGYFLGWDEGWPVLHGPGKRRSVEMVHSVVENVINAHLAGDGDSGSMVDLLIKRQQRNPELALDVTALRNEAATIFMAGHETTATTLTWALYCVARSPWVEQKLLAELDTHCPGRTPTIEDLDKLDYARSVIMETLRLYPPVPLLPRQAREADEVGGLPVAKGGLVMIAPWLIQRCPDIWENPNHFMPERFENNARYNPFAFIPFSVGPRICAGLNFGLSEAILCLAILVRMFRVSPRQGYVAEPVCRLTLRPAGGMPVTVHSR